MQRPDFPHKKFSWLFSGQTAVTGFRPVTVWRVTIWNSPPVLCHSWWYRLSVRIGQFPMSEGSRYLFFCPVVHIPVLPFVFLVGHGLNPFCNKYGIRYSRYSQCPGEHGHWGICPHNCPALLYRLSDCFENQGGLQGKNLPTGEEGAGGKVILI